MSLQDALQLVQPVLSQYGIKPHYVEQNGSAFKVYSDKGTFALKEADPYKGMDFVRNVHYLYQRGYNRIVPIYPTPDGRYAVLYSQRLFYLMPWISNEKNEDRTSQHKKLFRELARLHTLTVKDIEVSEEDTKNHYEQTNEQWKKEASMLDEMIEACEQKWYMSPFELLFCTYYHDISQALKFANRKLDDWYEVSKDAKKMRMVIVHGKVSPEHFLYDEKGYGYFINLEDSRYASPLHDLLPFVAKNLESLPRQDEDMVDWIYTYASYFSLKDEEMELLTSYLAHPGPAIQVLERYYKSKSKFNQQKAVQELQKAYWRLKNIEYVVMRIDEIERKKKQEKEGAQGEG
ncbi:spore coat protein YsxE [Bacillus carboniphilus]|uniref:Spore coat protein YsxE n=1 Tax=Bacillus carboniphilus TaxID=86663 RepID=A0ABN0WDH8_9BACI